MTEISFYVSQSNNSKARLQLAYRLVEKAFENSMSVHIHCQSLNECEQVDAFLWAFKDLSFIPHGLLDQQGKREQGHTVSLGFRTENGTALEPEACLGENALLINLSLYTPLYFQHFTRLAEVINQDAEVLANGRKRYAYYRKQGYNPAYYHL